MFDKKMPEAWRVLRIQSEIVDGIEHLIRIQHAVNIFGSARLPPGSSYYREAEVLVEVFKDRSLALPPLNTTLARRMMEQTRISRALKGVRGRQAVDMAALEQILVNFSQLIVEQPWIKELDINPLLAMEPKDDGRPSLIALDARVVVYGAETAARDLPRLAVRPYPSQYAAWWTLKNGQKAIIRPIRPEDEPMLVKFHQTLNRWLPKSTKVSAKWPRNSRSPSRVAIRTAGTAHSSCI